MAETALLIALQDAHVRVAENRNRLNLAIERLHTKRMQLLNNQPAANTNVKKRKRTKRKLRLTNNLQVIS